MAQRSSGPVRTNVCPYPFWPLYFPSIIYDVNSPTIGLIPQFIKYFESYVDVLCKSDINVQVDFRELCEHCGVQSLGELVRDEPMNTLAAIGLAVHELMATAPVSAVSLSSIASVRDPIASMRSMVKYNVMLINYEPITRLRDLKSNAIGKFICIRGTVVRVSNVKPLAVAGEFLCSKCGTSQIVTFADGKYSAPTKCPSGNCRSRSFELQRSSPNTKTIDWQKIRVQEMADDDSKDSGRIPRSVEVELTSALVDRCVPGDIVNVTGIVKVVTTEDGGRNKERRTMYLLYIEANSLTNAKSSNSANAAANGGDGADLVQYSIKDMYLIEDIQKQPKLFRLIVQSICPGIFGHEIVKAGLALALFGGRRRYVEDKNRVAVRGDPHVLVVGDPGMGKSQMLTAMSAIAPRGVYVCGNSTTTAGLTVTVLKDKDTGDYSLEAGALVLADQGVCCIDEFDKMGAEHQALLEAMEQQSISIAKAGVCCTLPTRTSVIAAANPVGGHYSKSKTVSENLRMGSALLSRFDLIFILLDKPNQKMDQFLSDHVIAMHSNKRKADSFVQQEARSSESVDRDAKSLEDRLKVAQNETIDVIPTHLLRKYIGYARKYVQPVMNTAAANILQNFYLELREKHRSIDNTPITTRQLESMIRLAEARARLELREEVTEADAKDIIEIMKQSLFETEQNDDMFNVDFSKASQGSGSSKMAQIKRFVAELQLQSERTYNNLFTHQQLYQFNIDLNMRIPNFEEFVETLNQQGYLLKKGNHVYKVQTSSIQ